MIGNLISRFIYFRVIRWKLVGRFPDLNKFLIAVVPHTSNYDFVLGILIRSVLKEQINYVGKKELFTPLTAWFFRGLGGTPINRGKSENTVDAIVRIYNSHSKFRIAFAPEGTRKKVDEWKTGFYHIAHLAAVPIVPVAFDYAKKQIVMHPPFYTTGDIEKDFVILKKYFEGVVGKIPENV